MAAAIGVFWSKAPLSVSRLKRFHATGYAEAALYETFNRFRIGYAGADSVVWDSVAWADGTDVPTDTAIVFPDGVSVEISVVWDDMNTPADTSDDRVKVSATVDQDDISL
jgi:hypothetical protein